MANGIVLKNPPEEIRKLIVKEQRKIEDAKNHRVSKEAVVYKLLRSAYLSDNGKK